MTNVCADCFGENYLRELILKNGEVALLKWTRKWTGILDLRVLIGTSKYTLNSSHGPTIASGKHLRTDRDGKFTAL